MTEDLGCCAIADSLCRRQLPDVLNAASTQKFLTREGFRLHCRQCRALSEIFPYHTEERRLIQVAVAGAFPEWNDSLVGTIVLSSVMMRMARSYMQREKLCQWVEYFSGDSRLSRAMRDAGFNAKATTWELGQTRVCKYPNHS